MTTETTGKVDSTSTPPAFSSPEVKKILQLAKGSKSIELKLSVPLTEHSATIKGIGLDPVEAEPRQVYFFDTPDLALNQAGLIVRARRIQGGRADTVVKLRPVDPETIDAELSRSESFKIELDVMPGAFVCSASYKGVCSGQEVLDVAAGEAPIRPLFSKEQRAFYDAHAPAGIEMNSLSILGPTFLLRAKHRPKDFDRSIVVEMWLYPDGSRILEISTKCLPSEAFQVATEFKVYLGEKGIAIGASQTTKTNAALEFFKARLESGLPVG
ncbi:hypothetical protein [Thiocapsa roseopersicina]|uniref:Adenylate cyclase n=1 Tax=Thiocapsa roseopersicina TaxID=1058 RepID=A0A1H3DVI5_THIRO|nr:hypothetical protein [Thiocapsa roseopersicina]SDX70128.1 hypothetical protein SAMN05421783_1625 [Thiocapsa roseopersicina]